MLPQGVNTLKYLGTLAAKILDVKWQNAWEPLKEWDLRQEIFGTFACVTSECQCIKRSEVAGVVCDI